MADDMLPNKLPFLVDQWTNISTSSKLSKVQRNDLCKQIVSQGMH